MTIPIYKVYFYYFFIIFFILQLMEHLILGTYKVKLLFSFASLILFIIFTIYKHIKINIKKKNFFFLILFFLSSSISALLSTNTFEGFFRIGTYLFPLILGFFLSRYKTVYFTKAFYKALFAFNFLIFILSIFQPNFDNQFRLGGILNMPTVIIMHLYTLLIILLIHYFLDKKKWHLPIIAILYTMIFLTLSRTGMFISLFVPVLILFYLKKIRLLTFISIALGVFILFNFDRVYDTVLVLMRLKDDISISPREHWISQAYHAIKVSPFFGIGMGNIPFWHISISNPDTSGVLFPSSIERVANQVGYHLILAENGIIGFILFILWIFYTLKIGFYKLKIVKNKNHKLYIQLMILYFLFIAYMINIATESFIGTAFDVFTISMFCISGIFMNIKGNSQ